ncbi:hypothetical protein BJY01DRAFT_214027 [Aspergillus pseudoustus]|uniref:Uncharacterized protein n=1 Tax=Aspergillus pseudoustus TaxID=1810923 RepID=A0ABR4K033_9EURO
MPKDALGMNAWLDTGSVRDLMDYRHFDRLKETHNIRLEPSDVDIVTLNDEEIEVHGIARNVVWQLREGYKTYHSDFYVLKMDQYDVLAGWDTIFKYELLKLGPDIKSHNDKTREKEKHWRRRQRELTKSFPGI